ncbi:MAG TPA: hypothetical protein VGD10_01620 [Allosphingosinicella sp.]|uniref:hypothetical protein n=1 Tax=Allosphingosinicella sp. TaxID=2823234 RepID=UPI002ED85AD3
MHHPIADRAAYADATALIEDFGTYAADEAAARAEKGRELGNVFSFCRWRQAERAVALIAGEGDVTAIH